MHPDHSRHDWHELRNGNWITNNSPEPVTVFQLETGDNAGRWTAITGSRRLKPAFDRPDDAMEAVDRCVNDDDSWLPPLNRSPSTRGYNARTEAWRRYKDERPGSWRRMASGAVLSVRQAKSGQYYCVSNGELVRDLWFDTEQEARDYLEWKTDFRP